MRIDLSRAGLDGIRGNFLKLRNDFLDKVAFDIDRVHVLLEVGIWKLVARFKLAIVIALFLNSIIRQVNEPISYVLQIEVFAACAQVAIAVPVPLQVTVNRRHQRVAADVKLAVLVEQRPLDILLNNIRSLLPIEIRIWYDFFNLRKLSANLDAAAPIRVLARLDYPNLFP